MAKQSHCLREDNDHIDMLRLRHSVLETKASTQAFVPSRECSENHPPYELGMDLEELVTHGCNTNMCSY